VPVASKFRVTGSFWVAVEGVIVTCAFAKAKQIKAIKHKVQFFIT
jgi:hypothetical protein